AGTLIVNETLELPSNTNWNGGWTSSNEVGGQFSFGSWATVWCYYANPCLYSNNAKSATYQNLTVMGAGPGGNGGTVWMTDDIYNLSWHDVSMDSNQSGAGDYIGRSMLIRSTQTGGDLYHFDHVSFSGGPGQVLDASWAPLVYFPV